MSNEDLVPVILFGCWVPGLLLLFLGKYDDRPTAFDQLPQKVQSMAIILVGGGAFLLLSWLGTLAGLPAPFSVAVANLLLAAAWTARLWINMKGWR